MRVALAARLAALCTGGATGTLDAHEIAGLKTGSDREVMQSLLHVKRCFGTQRRGAVAGIGVTLGELFATAVERMKQLPPEPPEPEQIVAVRQVRRL